MSGQRSKAKGSEEPFAWQIDDLEPIAVKSHEVSGPTPKPAEREVVRVREGPKDE